VLPPADRVPAAAGVPLGGGFGEQADVRASSEASRTWERLRRDPGFWIGSIIVVVLVGAAVFADQLSPYDPNLQIRDGGLTAEGAPQPPSDQFLLGTDRLGRDYLSRMLHGARTSLAIGIGAAFISTVIGAAVGCVAGFVRTARLEAPIGTRRVGVTIPVESILMRITDVVLSLPALLIAIALVAVVGPSLWLSLVVIGALLWTVTARVVYSRVRQVRALEYVEAAHAVGATPSHVLLRHVLPQTYSVLIVYAALGIAATVLFEAGLSFLGVGAPPPAASWGGMISEHAGFYRTDPRLLIVPGLAIMATVLGFNLIGDAVHDAIDPTGRA
jgi:peptide/nickel transport system permease protein